MLFRNSIDQESLGMPLSHMSNLKGSYGLSFQGQAPLNLKSYSGEVSGVIPFSNDADALLHGFYLAPTYFLSQGKDYGRVQHEGWRAWSISLGRANLDIPQSIFRGFLQLGYRSAESQSDAASDAVLSRFALSSSGEKRSSLILNFGVATLQNDLVEQKKPLIDSTLHILFRYDYEKGDFFVQTKTLFFYPAMLDLGLNLSWLKIFRNEESPLFEDISDDLAWGPQLRKKWGSHFLSSISLQWHAYRDFSNQYTIPAPVAQLQLSTCF